MTQSSTAANHKPLTERERQLASQVVNIAFTIHKAIGPGLLESVYEKCFCYELKKRKIPYLKQQYIDIVYDGLVISEGLRIDILADDLIIIELKAQENYHPVWDAQLLSYLKLTGKRLGYIFNFHVPLMKDGMKRMIL
ncbi:GxxExxY protein [Agriterribacter sp.]|uniref:GxxExxY protein n=1 Tax=Agriterribacter sp. TaxID=2821509 RepID=UPI002B835B0A|nr:GxxExxY protein [Agriterribacter sp.]HRO46887.1 GxxExxY protein [Agriterribacter sp.]HRQ18224.1 GxxExxY protein [Agriterribacter sp.]